MGTDLESLLGECEVAEITGLSLPTLRRWRLQQQGPRYAKLGGSIRYRKSDITAWLESRIRGGQPIAVPLGGAK